MTTHQSVKQYIHLTTQPTNPQTRGARGRVGREPHSGRKHHQTNTNQKQSAKTSYLLLVIGQLVLVSWSPYNVYTPSLSTR